MSVKKTFIFVVYMAVTTQMVAMSASVTMDMNLTLLEKHVEVIILPALLWFKLNGRLSDYATYIKNSLFSVSILDIDECKIEGPVCPVNSNCNNTVGSYDCFCEEGYRNEGYRNKTLCIGNFTI